MAAGELVTEISFVGSLVPLDNLNKGLDRADNNITRSIAAFTAAGLALNGFIAYTLSAADAQAQLANETNVSIENIQELGYVASISGSSMQQLENSIRGLDRRIGEAATKGNEAFARLGISVRDASGRVKDADQVLLEVRDSFERLNLSVGQQRSFAEQLGIDESLLQTLRRSRGEIEELRQRARALGVVTSEQAKQIINFNDSLTTMRFGLESVRKQVAIALSPQLRALADDFTNLLIVNKDLIQEGLKNFFELMNAGFGAVARFGDKIVDLVDFISQFESATYIAAGAMLYLNKAFLLNPVTLITAGIAALILAVDDLAVGLEGGRSVIAEWFQEWFNVDIFSVLSGIKDFIVSIFTFLDERIQVFKNVFGTIIDLIDNFKLSDLNPFSDEVSPNINGVNALNLAPNVSSSTSTASQTNNFNISVVSNDPVEAGRQVNNGLSEQLKIANVQFNKGGL